MIKNSALAWISLSAALLGGACATPGERARSGECPPEEECSDKTPEGLFFAGAALGGLGESLERIAVGGTQTVRVRIGATSDTRRAFTEPFDATVGEPLRVTQLEPAVLELLADDAGSAYLRILDPETGELFDRVAVYAHPIDRVSFWLRDYGHDEVLLYAGGRVTIGASLYNDANRRLVDEGLSFVADDAASLDRLGWDLVEVIEPALGELEVGIVTSSGAEFGGLFDVVDTIDSIERAQDDGTSTFEDEIAVGELEIVCFDGTLEGVPVAGLDWNFDIEGPVEISPWLVDRCVALEGLEPGDATLSISAAGLEQTLDLVVVEPSEGAARLFDPHPFFEESQPTPGTRARGAREAESERHEADRKLQPG
jgi:hypothetical protein